MANRWLVQNLINNAKRRGFIVQSDDPADGFGAEDFLALIDDVIRSRMVPMLKRVREGYLIRRVDVALTSGTDTYAIPGRAAAEALHSILGGDNWEPLQRTTADEAHAFVSGPGLPGYYLEDDSVIFTPSPDTQTVRFLIFNRPNMVVDATRVGYVHSINTGAREVTIRSWDAGDEDFTSSVAPTQFTSSATYDFVKGEPGFRCRAMDLTASIASNILTFTDALPANLAVGDFVCLAGETPIAQIPAELHPMLAEALNFTLLAGKGDPKADRSERAVAQLEKDAVDMLTPRVASAAKYIQSPLNVGRNMRRGLGWWRR